MLDDVEADAADDKPPHSFRIHGTEAHPPICLFLLPIQISKPWRGGHGVVPAELTEFRNCRGEVMEATVFPTPSRRHTYDSASVLEEAAEEARWPGRV